MIDPNSVKNDMPVIGSDGETLGKVDAVEGGDRDGRIKLKREGSPDGRHHYVSLADVASVDEHVHLSRTAADMRSGFLTAGAAGGAAGVLSAAATTTTATEPLHGAREVHVEGDRNWLPWILGSLALLALLIFGLRSCGTEPAAVVPTKIGVVDDEQNITLPGGGTVAVAPRTIGYDLQAYLASGAAAPRTFRFERLNFDTARADIRPIDRATVDGIGQILAAYPAARVRLGGFADARGDAADNAELGANRAKAVAAALVAKGVAADRIETATGGETVATDTNATAQGQAENRRTELIVLSR